MLLLDVTTGSTVDFSNTDGNIVVGQNGTNLTFNLNDTLLLGISDNTPNNNVVIDGKNGSILVNAEGTNGENSIEIDAASGTITGLTGAINDQNWSTFMSENSSIDDTRAATEADLRQVAQHSVQYALNDKDGTPNYDKVVLGNGQSSKYKSDEEDTAKRGGVSLTNVAYATVTDKTSASYDGSAAVNVDLLNDYVGSYVSDNATYTAGDGVNITRNEKTKENVVSVNAGKGLGFSEEPDKTGTKELEVKVGDNLEIDDNNAVALKDNLNLGDGKILIDGSNGNASINLGTEINLDGNAGTAVFGGVQVNKETGENTIIGLTNTEWSADGTYNSGRAATEEQLSDVAEWAGTQINNSDWTVSTNNGDKTTDIKNGDTVDFSNTDGNIVVSQEVTEDGTSVKFDLADKVNIGDKIELNGEDGNARFHSGDEAYVDIFGATGSMKLSNGVYNISIGGSDGTITGLTNTTWDGINIVPSRAATEGQLQQAINDVQTDLQNNDKHLVANPDSADGHYFVDGKNQINMQVQNGYDENGKPKYDTVTIDNVAQASDVGDVNDFNEDLKNEDGSHTTVVDAVNNLDDKVDNLGDRVDDIETTAGKHSSVSNTDNNIKIDSTGTNENGGIDYKVDLNSENITLGDDNNNVVIEGTKGNISTTGTVSAGNASMSSNGFSVGDKTYITSNGINANNQKVTNVAAGEISATSTDAVNGSQLYAVGEQVVNNSNAINNMGNQVNRLSNRIDKVGAGAAALAALHPLDFDPDDKLSFAAGYGNYAGENAVAVGAFYQPNEDTMFSVGGTFGNDENMVNAGVSFKLGQKSNVSRSRVSMAKELVSLRDEVAQLKALMAHAGILPSNGQLDTSDMFPDVPENHWAYEYIHELAKLGIVDGYPDGNFEGDRMMTRYEMAAIVYRAMQKGVNVDSRMFSEFEPELKLIRVDVVARDDDGNPTIERVRVNDDTTQA